MTDGLNPNTENEQAIAVVDEPTCNESQSTPEVVKQDIATNTVQDSPVFGPLGENDAKGGIAISFPPDTVAKIDAALEAIPNVGLNETADGASWVNHISNSAYTVPYRNWFRNTADRPTATYRQSVNSEKGPLTPGSLKFNDAVGSKLTGERAVLRVRALTGLGSVIMIPLWHSGFWITLKAPTEAAMLELNRRLNEEKISLGRATYGLAYANNSVFFAGWLLDFALSHVYDTSLKPELTENLRSRISQFDIPLVVWGLACTIWPNGFPFARAVLDQTGEPNKVIREKVNVGKLLWVDTSELTPWQISHMAQRHGSTMTAEMLERYRSEFTRGKGRSVALTENLSITLRTPNIDQYLISGQKWVNNIVAMVDQAFSMQPNDGIRNDYITDQGKATNMRQYGHFVESLEVAGEAITDLETLEQTIDVLSSDDSIRSKFFDAVKEFVEDSTIAIVAIPVMENEQEITYPRFPHLLPLDVLSVFFILLVQKVTQIQVRG